MKEVSCKVLDVFLRRLKEKRIPAERLVAGTKVPLHIANNKNERIDWSDFVAIMANARELFTDDEYVDMGGAFFRTPAARFVAVVAPLMFSVPNFYRWVNQSKNGVGNQMFTNIKANQRQLSPSELEVELTLADGYEMCWDFFVVTRGTFIEMPRFLGLGPAQVELTRLKNGARYGIVVPEGGAVMSRVRRTLMWPFNVRAAATELKTAHESLQERFEQLELARAKQDQQARQLRTANAVIQLIHGDLDLDRTLDAVTRALIEQAGFVGAAVDLDTLVDGVRIHRSALQGQIAGVTALTRTLEGRGGNKLGLLRVVPRAESEWVEREELLAFIVPTVSMALDNAVSFLTLESFHKGLEARVAERTAELSQARDALAETVRHLEEAKQVRERIFANVNHEIRTPLALILLAVDAARAHQDPVHGEISRSLDAIEQGARRLLRMVDDLLLLAEGREKEITLALTACNLTALVEAARDAWTPAAMVSGFVLTSDIAAGCHVNGDSSAIERVLSNLLSNALKYTPRGGAIHVSLTSADGLAKLAIRDTGCGIDSELRGRLFGRFERGEPSLNGGASGSGLGLSLVKELVEAQGGTIDVESVQGEGSAFFVTWPAVASPGGLLALPPKLGPLDFGIAVAQDARNVYEPSGTAKATILLAEDDQALRDRIAGLLSTEYRVFVAADGREALALAALHHPDLLVTDLAMPGMDGIELTRRFRALDGNRVSPVLLLTAFGDIGHRLAGFDAGAIDYIVKPFEASELRARIRSQLALRGLALQLLQTEKLAALGMLSAGLAHEMRNPANGVVNAVEPLRGLLPPDLLMPENPVAQLLDVIEQCGAQMASLSRHLLGFRRSAALERRPVALDLLIARVCRTAQPALLGVELRERLEYKGPLACAEPLMTQVLANLLDNAAYAAGRGGWVEVRTAVEHAAVIVEFRDSGSGIPVEIRERIFEPFFTTKPPGSGTGLGLATARDIVMRHGGTLDVRDSAGATVVRMEMPMETN